MQIVDADDTLFPWLLFNRRLVGLQLLCDAICDGGQLGRRLLARDTQQRRAADNLVAPAELREHFI